MFEKSLGCQLLFCCTQSLELKSSEPQNLTAKMKVRCFWNLYDTEISTTEEKKLGVLPQIPKSRGERESDRIDVRPSGRLDKLN